MRVAFGADIVLAMVGLMKQRLLFVDSLIVLPPWVRETDI